MVGMAGFAYIAVLSIFFYSTPVYAPQKTRGIDTFDADERPRDVWFLDEIYFLENIDGGILGFIRNVSDIVDGKNQFFAIIKKEAILKK